MNVVNDFNKIIEKDIGELFIDNPRELDKNSEVQLDEVELMDPLTMVDREISVEGHTQIRFIEDEDISSIISGIPIKKGSIDELLRNNNFGAIDGSTGSINRTMVCPVLARAAFGADSYNFELERQVEVINDVRYVVSIPNIVKNPSGKIKNADKNQAFSYSVKSFSDYLGLELEQKSVQIIIDKYIKEGNEINYLGLDGPLYPRDRIPGGLKSVKTAIKNGTFIFAIVKRSQDNAYSKHIMEMAKKVKSLQTMKLPVFTDREFLEIKLDKGYRTPFYVQVNKQERSMKFDKENKKYRRVCSWVKLDTGKVCRVEIPFELAGKNDDFEMAKDMIDIIYKQSQQNQGKLPIYFERADTMALISELDKKRYAVYLDSMLRKLGLPIGDPNYWK